MVAERRLGGVERFASLRVLLPVWTSLSWRREGEGRRQPLSAVAVATCVSQADNVAAGLEDRARSLSDPFRWDAVLQHNFWQQNMSDQNCSSLKGSENETLKATKTLKLMDLSGFVSVKLTVCVECVVLLDNSMLT